MPGVYSATEDAHEPAIASDLPMKFYGSRGDLMARRNWDPTGKQSPHAQGRKDDGPLPFATEAKSHDRPQTLVGTA